MFDILSIIPGKRKVTGSGWHTFNAVCCSHRGHRADKRMRGGILFDGTTRWGFHCFNCGYSCKFELGKSISDKTRQLLLWCGCDLEQIQRWSLESLQHKDLLDFSSNRTKTKISLRERPTPPGELLDPANKAHAKYISYLASRSLAHDDYPFMVTPNDKAVRQRNRIIIPYTYHKTVVGHTSRYLDNQLPKYVNDQQPGFVFGIDFQKSEWQVAILVEGIFDALSINGCAYMHDTINSDQVATLSQLNKRIILVPDQDFTGLQVCDRALELGYHVSIPHWGKGVKDVNDAVVKFGRLPTLLSIMQAATMSRIKIDLRRRAIGRL